MHTTVNIYVANIILHIEQPIVYMDTYILPCTLVYIRSDIIITLKSQYTT